MVMGEETLETQVAVIGGGPGGYSAAFRAADLGLDVVLIEEGERLGGTCLLRGCIPSKALLETSTLIQRTQEAQAHGISFGKPKIDLPSLRDWKNSVVDRLVSGLGTLAKHRDIEVVHGRATFTSSTSVRLEGADIRYVKFKHAILATGSRPAALKDHPFTPASRIIDSTGALDLEDIPKRLLVIGAGYIGMELGSVYASLGSKVTVVEMLDSILPGVDAELSKPLMKSAQKLFEAIYLKTRVAKMEETEKEVSVLFEGDVSHPQQTFDRVLIAIGRRPNSDQIGLENTAVKLDDHGFVIVDEQRRSTDAAIFAIGDVAGNPMLAHKAMAEGKVAAEVIAGKPAGYDVTAIPAIVYTDPEIAWCGLTEAEAKQQGLDVEISRFSWRASGRALTLNAPEGLTKLIFDRKTQRVLGVGLVGRGAENLIAEGALAIEMGAVAQDLALTVHPHPTLSETLSEAADVFLGFPIHTMPLRKR